MSSSGRLSETRPTGVESSAMVYTVLRALVATQALPNEGPKQSPPAAHQMGATFEQCQPMLENVLRCSHLCHWR